MHLYEGREEEREGGGGKRRWQWRGCKRNCELCRKQYFWLLLTALFPLWMQLSSILPSVPIMRLVYLLQRRPFRFSSFILWKPFHKPFVETLPPDQSNCASWRTSFQWCSLRQNEIYYLHLWHTAAFMPIVRRSVVGWVTVIFCFSASNVFRRFASI